MDLKIKLLLGLCLTGLFAKGQSVSFLGVTPDARAAAMGGIGSATSADAWSVYWNGAKAVFAPSKAALAYSYMPRTNDFMKDSRLHDVGMYYKWNDKNAIVAGFRHSSSGKMTIDDGITSFTIHPGDYTIEAGYSRLLLKGLSAGATVRYIHSDLDQGGDDQANGVAFDLSMYYRLPLSWLQNRSSWTWGVTYTNFGPKLAYGDDKYALPSRVNLGTAVHLPFSKNHELMCAAEGNYRFSPSEMKEYELALGAEYRCYRIASIRGGYHWGDLDHGGSNYVSLGCGVHYYHIEAGFAYQWANKGSEAMDKLLRFSVAVNWEILKGNRK